MSEVEFIPFPKIPRLNRHMVVTEKIDGTNASVHFSDDGTMRVASRNRWITPEDDNYSFAAWCRENRAELEKLGPGAHFGEWWGEGIQRRYGLGHKRFSLFNTARWRAVGAVLPACVGLVPVMYEGSFSQQAIVDCVERLKAEGSLAAPGFMRPEGVVVYLAAARQLFKVTCEHDDEPKSKVA